MATQSIFTDGVFPIMGWSGPADGMIRGRLILRKSMAEAGFTVSHSTISWQRNRFQRPGYCRRSGIRLLVVHRDWDVSDTSSSILTRERKSAAWSMPSRIIRSVWLSPA